MNLKSGDPLTPTTIRVFKKYGVKFTRKFGGKNYKLYTYFIYKSLANKFVRDIRKKGGSARIVTRYLPSGSRIKSYFVYIK